MSMLLHANFKRMFKSGIFFLCIALSLVLGGYLAILTLSDVQVTPSDMESLSPLDGCLFLGILEELFISAIFTGFFIGTDYSDGTIRNKLTAGHTRFNIYLANLISCCAASAACMLTYTGTVAVLAACKGIPITLPAGKLLLFTLCALLIVSAQCALLVMLAMLIFKKAVSAVTLLILTAVMLGTSLNIYQTLNLPETYSMPILDYEVKVQVVEEGVILPTEPPPPIEWVENPRYLRGWKRTAYEQLHNLLPTSQAYQIMELAEENTNAIMLYDVLMIVVFTGIGTFIFRRKDLK